jgi:hypothetical protein
MFLAIDLRTAIVQRDTIEGESLCRRVLCNPPICAGILQIKAFCLALVAMANYYDECRQHSFSQNCGEKY